MNEREEDQEARLQSFVDITHHGLKLGKNRHARFEEGRRGKP